MRMDNHARAKLLSLLKCDMLDGWVESKLRRRVMTCLLTTMNGPSIPCRQELPCMVVNNAGGASPCPPRNIELH